MSKETGVKKNVDVVRRFRPEISAGSYARDNTAIALAVRVASLLRADMTVLDLGAGRGEIFDHLGESPIADLVKIQGKVKRVVGLDVDDAVLQHPFLDDRYVIGLEEPYPLEAESVDLVVADWVFEHVQEPKFVASELMRVIKPGGWICARTPNKWGYNGMATRLVPNSVHVRLLKVLSPQRQERDIFPTAFKLNTRADIRRFFPKEYWEDYSYFSASTPRFFGNSALAFRLIEIWQTLAPEQFKSDFLIILRKR